jgi:anaerobic selenocysteine-containing dehydrogenase
VLYPYIRRIKTDSLKRVGWDEAVQLIMENLTEVISQYGSSSVLLLNYLGNQGLLVAHYAERLWSFLGATRHDGAVCSASGHEGICLHYGLSYGVQPEDLVNMKCIVFWGFNAKVSSPHFWFLSEQARRNCGTRLVTIDPRKTPTSEESDAWLNPRPGSDVALAYGVARCLIEKGLVNRKFIEKRTLGYESYSNEVLKWTPERVERETGIEWSQIGGFAELYYENRPGTIMIGLGLNKSFFGAESVRAVSLLPALLGYDRGFHYSDSRGRLIDWGYLNGTDLANKKSKVVSQVALGSMLEEGKFKFVFVYGMNPLVTLPDAGKVKSGFARRDIFTVVHDTHWTATAKAADVVLPASTYLEKDGIALSDHHRYCRFSNKAVDPLGESLDEVSLMLKLARGLQIRESWLYEDAWEAARKSLRLAFEDGSPDDLFHGKVMKLKLRPKNEYQTVSGKIEFYSSKAAEIGANPLPQQMKLESNTRDRFVLLNSSLPNYTHSQFTDVYGPIPQIVWINPDDAKEMDIHEGQKVRLSNDLGEIMLFAAIIERVPHGVLWMPRPATGIDGKTLNNLVAGTAQFIGKGSTYNSTTVAIETIVE